ncbi:hypothetical protein BJ322DRAFT_1114359 [Thelephora terrestris]|uniref:Uncharacterized protein n=1 Tax=Thelephora terrestris TaxID=56493 RepID=A0A9P6L137_9AGAM|nr:hypothetical protein BJ322DRAFT_1114359 [Thelephora terrestris]
MAHDPWRIVTMNVANSTSPWVNPDVNALQPMYEVVYPASPARLRHNDAVFHPTVTALAVLRNHIASEALKAVWNHLQTVHRKKKLQTIESRARYIEGLFKNENDHPIIWREYVEGDIQDHPEVGGYKTTRRGVFQSDPILAALLGYYTSYGIMEGPPSEDPGPGNRPMGILALASAAVERAYRMHETGDFVNSGQRFDRDSCGSWTERYMDYITNNLGETQWNSLFGALSAFSKQAKKAEAMKNCEPKEPRERVPLPPSDPPTPPHND